jgi:hypothetical protein
MVLGRGVEEMVLGRRVVWVLGVAVARSTAGELGGLGSSGRQAGDAAPTVGQVEPLLSSDEQVPEVLLGMISPGGSGVRKGLSRSGEDTPETGR